MANLGQGEETPAPGEGAERRPGRAVGAKASVGVKVGLFVGGLLIALGATEVLLRGLVPVAPLMRFEQLGEAHKDRDTVQFLSLVESDEDVFWRLAPGKVLPEDSRPFFGLISNEQGLREDHEIPRKKGVGEIRVLFLGDSCTFGYGLGAEETFVELVEAELRRRVPDIRVECINAGVPGWSLFQGWRFLESEGFGFEPDLVVVAFGWNDNDRWDGSSDMEQYQRLRAAAPPAALRWSRLGSMAWQAVAQRPPPPPSSKRPRLLPEEFAELLGVFETDTREHGADLMLLVLPGRANFDPSAPQGGRLPLQLVQLQFGIRRHLGDGGPSALVDGVAVAQEVVKSHPISELFLDHVHPTALLNGALAEALVERIEPWVEARVRH